MGLATSQCCNAKTADNDMKAGKRSNFEDEIADLVYDKMDTGEDSGDGDSSCTASESVSRCTSVEATSVQDAAESARSVSDVVEDIAEFEERTGSARTAATASAAPIDEAVKDSGRAGANLRLNEVRSPNEAGPSHEHRRVRRLSVGSAMGTGASAERARRLSLAPLPSLDPTSDEWVHNAFAASEITSINTSWAEVKAKGAEHVGVLIFKTLFKSEPACLQLFSFKDQQNLIKSAKLKMHGKRVVETVDMAVAGLRDPKALIPAIQALALKHVGFGIVPLSNQKHKDHYAAVGRALLQTLRECLGHRTFTPELEMSWTKVYAILSSTMIAKSQEVAAAVATAVRPKKAVAR